LTDTPSAVYTTHMRERPLPLLERASMKHGNPDAYDWDDITDSDESFSTEAYEDGEDIYEGWGWDSPESYLD